MKCEDCKYWSKADKSFGAGKMGWCRRYPPTMTIGQCCTDLKWQGISCWGEGISPLTRNDEWCGEFKNKTKLKQKGVL